VSFSQLAADTDAIGPTPGTGTIVERRRAHRSHLVHVELAVVGRVPKPPGAGNTPHPSLPCETPDRRLGSPLRNAIATRGERRCPRSTLPPQRAGETGMRLSPSRPASRPPSWSRGVAAITPSGRAANTSTAAVNTMPSLRPPTYGRRAPRSGPDPWNEEDDRRRQQTYAGNAGIRMRKKLASSREAGM